MYGKIGGGATVSSSSVHSVFSVVIGSESSSLSLLKTSIDSSEDKIFSSLYLSGLEWNDDYDSDSDSDEKSSYSTTSQLFVNS